MRELDLRMLRFMRTAGHTPGVERAAKGLGKAGNNAAVWVVVGILLAVIDGSNREAWLICAALGPIAIGLNFVVKLIVRRPRPVLEGLPSLGGAPSSLSFPSAHATASFAVATANEAVACADGKLSELGAPPSGGSPSSTGRGRLTISLTTKLSPMAIGPKAAQINQASRLEPSITASKIPTTTQTAALFPAFPKPFAALSTPGVWPAVRMKRNILRSSSRIGRAGYGSQGSLRECLAKRRTGEWFPPRSGTRFHRQRR